MMLLLVLAICGAAASPAPLEDIDNTPKVALEEKCLSGDCENGHGTYQSADGDRWEGGWKDGVPDGRGQYTYDDGSTYIGEMKEGQFSGKGMATFIM